MEVDVDQKAMFMKFWEKEAAATRKVIARVPQEAADYRPDPKARNARDLAWMIVYEEMVLADGMANAKFEWIPKDTPATMKEIVETYDRHHDALTARMQGVDANHWEREVPFVMDGKELMRTPGYEMAWGFLLDQIHHRGQLSTYLRPMGSTVPAIYGPSADES
jgi:uncharacterized damage-inducible protein DinB